MIYCAKFLVANLNFIFLPPTLVAILGDWGSYQKIFNSVLSAHRQRVYEKFGVCSSYDVRETLSGHDRQTDMAKSIFLAALNDLLHIFCQS